MNKKKFGLVYWMLQNLFNLQEKRQKDFENLLSILFSATKSKDFSMKDSLKMNLV